MRYSAYNLNKQYDSIQPWGTPLPIWNQSIVPCLVLTVASWHAYRFLRRQARWSGIPISSKIFHRVKGFSVVNEAEVDVFLELSCFFYDPVIVGSLICGSSAFSKCSFNIWKFLVHVLLKPGWRILSITDYCNGILMGLWGRAYSGYPLGCALSSHPPPQGLWLCRRSLSLCLILLTREENTWIQQNTQMIWKPDRWKSRGHLK